ncbi:flagellar biosynthesis protein FlhA [Natribacillus halophilus]|uniref:Flagellar biosynthesis protein FlhA n=1 Tax=Natribacillus halophilus TaxID=549003 RepID=A0A1G8PPF2_9BACI|nr:flagellar biosynthesis protein FlhA [Natribacillus halophilus]SDI94208.1 flagellar biosynthesis protein FlhA [Natribacillus halophilus]
MRARDLVILIGVILIVAMLIFPLPSPMIDVLIIVNISLSLLIILVAMNMREPLDFSIFPTILLLATLFRVGLSVSTTRAILSRAEAGSVIDTFGSFVVGSNALVGFVIFLILVVIQFIVIVKGAERVSEVGARFTLDAMPGKQMSIDADLNAGLITEQEAKQRREKIEEEADFYGSMDGASKFVKGDAIANIVIVLVNIIVGFIIGMMQHGMSFAEAANTYTLLTVGDGLVTQIPALLIATATGIVVTRAASDGSLGHDISEQVLAYPKLLYIASGTIFLLGVLTPIANIVTFPIAVFLGIGGWMLSRNQAVTSTEESPADEEAETEDFKSPDNVTQLLMIDPIEFEFGYGLIPIADANQGGDLLDRVVMIRRQLALELGIIVPVIRIRDNIQLQPNEYVINIRGQEVSRGELLLDHYMAMSPGAEEETVTGIETFEPAFGLPALWVDEAEKDQAEIAGYTVVDPPSVVSTHLTETIKRHAHELLGREETKQLVDHVKETYPALVEEVTPNPLNLGDIQKVLRTLLKEKISIRNLPVIFEGLADYGPMVKDPKLIAEYVRQMLSRQITNAFVPNSGPLYVVTLGGTAEKKIADALQQTEHGTFLSLPPDDAGQVIETIGREAEKLADFGQAPVILCSPAVRLHVRQLIERQFPHMPVLSYNELEPEVEIQSVGVVNVA